MGAHRRTPLRRQRAIQSLLAGSSVMVMVVCAVALAMAVLHDPPARTPGTPVGAAAVTRSEGEPNWVDVLAGLDAARAAAFGSGDQAALSEVYVGGSPALETETRLIRRYAREGLRVEGLLMDVGDVRLLEARGDRAVLRVRDRVAGGALVDAAGSESELAEDAWSAHRITLRQVAGEWRIAAVTAA
jgi:hypothetical protein